MSYYQFLDLVSDFIYEYLDALGPNFLIQLFKQSYFFSTRKKYAQVIEHGVPNLHAIESQFKENIKNSTKFHLFSHNSDQIQNSRNQSSRDFFKTNDVQQLMTDGRNQIEDFLQKAPKLAEWNKKIMELSKKLTNQPAIGQKLIETRMEEFKQKMENDPEFVNQFLEYSRITSNNPFRNAHSAHFNRIQKKNERMGTTEMDLVQKQKDWERTLDKYVQDLLLLFESPVIIRQEIAVFFQEMCQLQIIPPNIQFDHNWQTVLNDVLYHFSKKFFILEYDNHDHIVTWFNSGVISYTKRNERSKKSLFLVAFKKWDLFSALYGISED